VPTTEVMKAVMIATQCFLSGIISFFVFGMAFVGYNLTFPWIVAVVGAVASSFLWAYWQRVSLSLPALS